MGQPKRRSFAGQAVNSILLLIGFYLFVGTLAIGLIALPVLEVVYAKQLHVIAVILAFSGFLLLGALAPRRRQWSSLGVPFDAQSQPELWSLIERVAAKTEQQPPATGYLLDEVNAFVLNRGGFLGIGGTRVLGIGVPLMMMVNEPELEAILTHEFGHFDNGDTRLGGLVHSARSVMIRAIQADRGRMRWVFNWYANFYLRYTQKLSRHQELAADQLAAQLTGAETTAIALKRAAVGGAAFRVYWNEEYGPILKAGRRPPYLEGLTRTLRSPRMRAFLRRETTRVEEHDRTAAYDSHPPTSARIRALGCDPAEIASGFSVHPSSAMLRDLPRVEVATVQRQSIATSSLLPVAWDDVGTEILVPKWRAIVAEALAQTCPDMSPFDVPTTRDALADLGESIVETQHRAANRIDRISTATEIVSHYLALAAEQAGWAVHALPGEPIRFCRGDVESHLVDDWKHVIAGEIDAASWNEMVRALGISATVAAVTHGLSLRKSTQPFEHHVAGRRALTLDGSRARWGDYEISANDITEFWYRGKGNVLEASFRGDLGTLEMRLRLTNHQKRNEPFLAAWNAIVAWSHRYIEPRFVDAMLDSIAVSGSVRVGPIDIQRDGITFAGSTTQWHEVAGIGLRGSEVIVGRLSNTHQRAERLVAIDARTNGALCLSELAQALRAEARSGR